MNRDDIGLRVLPWLDDCKRFARSPASATAREFVRAPAVRARFAACGATSYMRLTHKKP
jgi:feruloyl-CoA synthase